MDKAKELFEAVQNGEFDFAFSEYSAMCEKAKSFVFNYLLLQKDNETYLDMFSNYEVFNSKLTPIEQIFYVAFRLYTADFSTDITQKTIIPFNAMLNEEIAPQQEVICEGKKYIIDFSIDFSRKCVGNERYVYPEFKDLKYAVELDGYNYHSSKKQMEYDYERENNLKKFGYIVVRFTGSQVYNKPLSCVDTLVKIILNDIRNKVNNNASN